MSISTTAEPGRFPVRVFHNLMFATLSPARPYPGECHAGDPALQAFATTASAASDHLAMCEEMFHLLNVGDDPAFGAPDARAVAYRARGNRSLSVGDLACVDGAWYACAPSGFRAVEPPRVATDAVAGSTPYAGVDQQPASGCSGSPCA